MCRELDSQHPHQSNHTPAVPETYSDIDGCARSSCFILGVGGWGINLLVDQARPSRNVRKSAIFGRLASGQVFQVGRVDATKLKR